MTTFIMYFSYMLVALCSELVLLKQSGWVGPKPRSNGGREWRMAGVVG